MSDYDGSIMSFVYKERARCTGLVNALRKPVDREFLIFCIENSVCVKEIDHFRKRYNELQLPDSDDIEDLM